MDLFNNIKKELEKLLDKNTLTKYEDAKGLLHIQLKSYINQNIGQFEVNRLVEYYVYSIIDDISKLENRDKDIWNSAKNDSSQRKQYAEFISKENPEKIQNIFSKIDQINTSAQNFQELIQKAGELNLDLDFLLQKDYSYKLEEVETEEILLSLQNYEKLIYRIGLPSEIKTIQDEDWIDKKPMTPQELFNRKSENSEALHKELEDFLELEEEINIADLAISGLEIEDSLDIPSNSQMIESAIKENKFVASKAEHILYASYLEYSDEDEILEKIKENPELKDLKDFLKVIRFSKKVCKGPKKERYSKITLKDLLKQSFPDKKFNKLDAIAELGTYIIWPYDIYKNLFDKKQPKEEMYSNIIKLATKAKLSKVATNTALLLYIDVYNELRRKSITLESQVAGCVYISSLMYKTPISRKELKLLQPHCTSNMNLVSKFLSNKYKISLAVDPLDILPRIASDLSMRQDTIIKAKEILIRCRKRDIVSNPYSIVGGALYIAAVLSGRRETQANIGDALGVSGSVIRHAYQSISKALGIEIEV